MADFARTRYGLIHIDFGAPGGNAGCLMFPCDGNGSKCSDGSSKPAGTSPTKPIKNFENIDKIARAWGIID